MKNKPAFGIATGIYKIAIFMLFTIIPLHLSAQRFETVVNAAKDSRPNSIRFFFDQMNGLHLVYEKQKNQSLSTFYHLRYLENGWSSPNEITIPFYNNRELHDVKTLTNGIPLLVFAGDNTDYLKVFNLEQFPSSSSDLSNDIISGVSNDQLQEIFQKNRRLFFSTMINERWITPQPISGTYEAMDPKLFCDENQTALLVFIKDQDKNADSHQDKELYYTVFKNNVWSSPVRLTSNSKFEYDVQIQNLDGNYVVIWSADEDGDFATPGDKQLRYATINPSNGSILKADSPIINNQYISPKLALQKRQNELVLIWSSFMDADQSNLQELWVSSFDGAWSAAKNQNIKVGLYSNPTLFEKSDSSLLVFFAGSETKAALFDGTQLFAPVTIQNLDQGSWLATDLVSELASNGDIIVGAVGFTPLKTQSDSREQTEIKWTRFPILSDLKLDSVKTHPRIKSIGGTVSLQFNVRNDGALKSGPFSVNVYQKGPLTHSFNEASLSPGDSREMVYEFVLDHPNLPVKIEIVSDNPETSKENNTAQFSVNVIPDYTVRSVKMADNGDIIADIMEKNGIAALPVPVTFYIQQNGTRSKIGAGEFDPNVGAPLRIPKPDLDEDIESFKIEVIVNEFQTVPEVLQSNNKGTFIYRPMPDLVINRFFVTANRVYLTVENVGNKLVNSADLLITDNPNLANQTGVVDYSSALFFENIDLSSDVETRFHLPRDQLEVVANKTLFAAINPQSTVLESNFNNNTASVFVEHTNVAGGGSGGGGDPGGGSGGGGDPTSDDNYYPKADLLMELTNSWCGSIQIRLDNEGDAPAFFTTIKVVNEKGTPVGQKSIPAVTAGANEIVSFKGLGTGNYSVLLEYSPVMGETENDQLSFEVLDLGGSECNQNIGRDVILTNLVLEESIGHKILRKLFRREGKWWNWLYQKIKQLLKTKDKALVKVDVSAVNFNSTYRKPFIRIPLILEIKEGTKLNYSTSSIFYIPETSEDSPIELSLIIPNEKLGQNTDLILKTPIRDDEVSFGNNRVNILIQ